MAVQHLPPDFAPYYGGVIYCPVCRPDVVVVYADAGQLTCPTCRGRWYAPTFQLRRVEQPQEPPT
jgi:hypothetical protein